MANYRKFLPGATKYGTLASQVPGLSSNPYALAGTALLGGFLESMQGKTSKINRAPYDQALMKYSKGAMDRSRRVAREVGSQDGSRLAARGLNSSALAEFLTNHNRMRAYTPALDHLNKMEADLEMQLAHTGNLLDLRSGTEVQNAWGDVGNTLEGLLIDKIVNSGDGELTPEQNQILNSAAAWLQKRFPNENINLQGLVNHLRNQRKKPAQTEADAALGQLPSIKGLTEGRQTPATSWQQTRQQRIASAPPTIKEIQEDMSFKKDTPPYNPDDPFNIDQASQQTEKVKIQKLEKQVGKENLAFIDKTIGIKPFIDALTPLVEWGAV